MQKDTYKKRLWIFLLVLLTLPLFQQFLHPVPERPLKGAIDQHTPGVFSFSNWFSGKFQEEEETYVTSAYGFHNTVVRLNNQIDYSLFGKVHARGVVLGKSNYLYEQGYISAYFGEDFKGWDTFKSVIRKIKFAQDSLAAMDKYLLVVVAPSKAYYYPEYIPDRLRVEKNVTNYEAFTSLAQKSGIHYIDFNRYFAGHKTSSKYPLFSKHGVHWSIYGACIVQDSLVNYINASLKTDLPEFYWEKIELDTARYTDNDIGAALNLLIPLKSDTLAYPILRLNSNGEQKKPNVLVISDSFYWTLYQLGFPGLFTGPQFWFYNKEIWPESEKATLYTNQVSVKEELKKKDIVILMCNPTGLDQIGWGFLDDVYRIFQNYDDPETAGKINDIKSQMYNNPEWLKAVTEKAINNHISLDSQMINDAIWMLNEKGN